MSAQEGEPALDADLAAAVQANDPRALVAVAARSALILQTEAAPLFLAMGQVGRVVLDPETPTASLVREANDFHLRLGSAFLLSDVRTADDLAYLLLHELAHLALGHASRFRWDGHGRAEREVSSMFTSAVSNIAADMLVARFLHELVKMTPGLDARVHGEGTPLTNALMCTPETLLRQLWICGHPLHLTDVVDAFYRRDAEARNPFSADTVHGLAHVYHLVWTAGMSLKQLTSRLIELLSRYQGAISQPPLVLVDDESSGRRMGPAKLGACLPRRWRTALREVRAGNFDFDPHASRAGHSAHARTVHLEGNKNLRKTEAVAELLRRFLVGSPLMKRRSFTDQDPQWHTPFPTSIRKKEAFWLAVGVLPPMYPFPAVRHQEFGPVRVYVDVSGSTRSCWRTVIDALRMVLSDRKVEAYQFSNVVKPLPLGVPVLSLTTTLGTDFDCVARHALGISNSFIITDGYASLSPDLRKRVTAAGSHFHLILLGDRSEVLEDELRQDFEGVLANERALIWLPRSLFGT